MLSWIATRIFYAVVFFMLGAWTVSESPHFRSLMHRASHVGSLSFDKMRDWTSETLIKTPDVTNAGSGQSSTASAAPPLGDARPDPRPPPAPQSPAATAPAAQSADASQAPAPAALQASTPARRPPPTAPRILLNRARQAYARKDINAAIDAYRAYLAQNPNAIGARGELGDVYFAAGRKQDAAQLYFQCATKNLDAGNIAGAKALVGAVREGDPAMADDLERRVAAASSKKN